MKTWARLSGLALIYKFVRAGMRLPSGEIACLFPGAAISKPIPSDMPALAIIDAGSCALIVRGFKTAANLLIQGASGDTIPLAIILNFLDGWSVLCGVSCPGRKMASKMVPGNLRKA